MDRKDTNLVPDWGPLVKKKKEEEEEEEEQQEEEQEKAHITEANFCIFTKCTSATACAQDTQSVTERVCLH